ncbi:MAG: GntR family transcriptional regulator [Eubacteriales bacterium]|nr:GntR family transcriptional regulator [Eubacteriales bacterium]
MAEGSLFHAKPLHGESVVNQVVKQITDSIIAGELKPGDKLPTEPEMCASFGIGRNSVREAIKILEAYGVVYIKRAEGTFVNDTYNQKMLDPMLYGILLEKTFKSDIIQMRKVFDTGIFYQIMGVLKEEHLEGLREEFEKLKEAVGGEAADPKKVIQADNAFHMYLARITENRLLCNMYEYVDRITTPSRTKTVERVLEQRQVEKFLQLHEEMISLLEERDYQSIERVLREHYQFWEID